MERVVKTVVVSVMLAALLMGCGGGTGTQVSLQERSTAASSASGPRQEKDLPPPLPELPDWAKVYAPEDPYVGLE